jgi:glycosyltransferase involved in cell wall biosynthesis
MRALLSVIDCYVSLHRSEGLGLGMAESMYLGKPVIATAYSGKLEFMNEGNAALVSYELVPVKEGEYPFWRDQVWAEPNVAHAAQFMRKMVDEPNYRTSLGQQAAKYLREHHSYAQMGRAMQARLIAIAEQLPE